MENDREKIREILGALAILAPRRCVEITNVLEAYIEQQREEAVKAARERGK